MLSIAIRLAASIPFLIASVLPIQLNQPNTNPKLPPALIGLVDYSPKPTPQFPDMTANYQKTVVIPAQEAAAVVAQANAAEEARIEAQAIQYTPPTPIAPQTAPTPAISGTGGVWAELRNCESGGNYTANTGNGYYGAYQYDFSTWGNYGGYARPDLAPSSIQDAKAQADQAARGWSPWPSCAAKLGL